MEIQTESGVFLSPKPPQGTPIIQQKRPSIIVDQSNNNRSRESNRKISLNPSNETPMNNNYSGGVVGEDGTNHLMSRRKLSATKLLATFSSTAALKIQSAVTPLANSSLASTNQQDSLQLKETNPGIGWNFVRKLGKIKRFIEKMKVANPTSSFRRLNIQHIKIINDLTYYFQNESDNKETANMQVAIKNAYQSVKRDIWNLTKRLRVFSPDSIWINLWRIIILCFTIIQIFLLPLTMSFNVGLNEDYEQLIYKKIPLTLFICDIIMNFNTGYYEEGGVLLNRKRIIKQYMLFQFWIDIVTLLIFAFVEELDNYALQHIFLLRLIQISDIVEDLDERWQIQQRFSASWTLMKLFLLIILLAHYCGCGFHYIGQLSMEYRQYSWLEKQSIEHENWQVKYLFSLYFSFITMITVGFGDITPMSNPERIYVICMTLVSSGVFAYTVNTVGLIFQERSKKLAKYLQIIFFISLRFWPCFTA